MNKIITLLGEDSGCQSRSQVPRWNVRSKQVIFIKIIKCDHMYIYMTCQVITIKISSMHKTENIYCKYLSSLSS